MIKRLGVGIIMVYAIFSACVTERELSYDEVQGIGGIRIDDMVQNYNKYYLPVYCNVSGLEKVTAAPKTMNSALAFKEIRSDISGDTIFITVVAALAGGEKGTVKCTGPVFDAHSIRLPKYRVVYKNPDNSETHIKDVKAALAPCDGTPFR